MILVQKITACLHNIGDKAHQAQTLFAHHAPIWRAQAARTLRALPEKFPVRHRIAAAAVAIPCFGVLTAFGIAPDTMINKVQVQDVVQNLLLPELTPLATTDTTYVHEERIQRGDTVASLLTRLQINDAVAEQTIRSNRDARALYQLVPGRTVRAVTTEEGKLVSLRYLNDNQLLSVDRNDNGDSFNVEEAPAQLEMHTEMKSGEIRNSLFGATDAAGVPDSIAVQMADIFSGDIDFHADLRRGDHFSVIYETYYRNGEPVKTGRVLAAEFINQGRPYQAVYFEPTAGKEGGYYSLDGKSLRRQFLRSPLEFSRITSGYTPMRYHPILKLWRAHRGIDFAAPIGTRVHATADGVVQFAGQQGGYGNLIILRHTSGVTTYYGHLSRFAVHAGMRVSQNDVIGYVGMTGLATGPHVHYEYRINNVYQNPLHVAMPSAPPIPTDQRKQFEAAVEALAQPLTSLRTLNLASAD